MTDKEPTYTATARLRVVKPVDGNWDAFGRTLRALRAPLHRVLNATVRELEIERREAPWWAPTDLDREAGRRCCCPRTASYRLARHFWAEERRLAAERLTQGKPYRGDDAIAETQPSSAAALGASGLAFARWQKYRKDSWKGASQLPSFRGNSPVPVASSSDAVRLTVSDGDAILDLRLTTSPRKRARCVVQACDGSGFARLRHLLDGAAKLGDVRLVEDTDRRLGKRQWFAFVSFTMPQPQREAGRTVAVHRGLRSFLAIAIARSGDSARDGYSEVLETGADIVAHKAAYAARRRSLGRQGRQLGLAAKGHGRERRFERITRLEDSEARWVKSKCQETAAHLFRRMDRHGATRILLEDWSNPASDGAPELGPHIERLVRQFPLAELRTAIEWGAKKRGYDVEICATDNNSRTCPACGHVHARSQSGTFACEACEFERNADIVFAWNMLRRTANAPPIEEAATALKRATRRLKGSGK